MKPNISKRGDGIFLSAERAKEKRCEAERQRGRLTAHWWKMTGAAEGEGGYLRESVTQGCCQASSKLHLTSCKIEGRRRIQGARQERPQAPLPPVRARENLAHESDYVNMTFDETVGEWSQDIELLSVHHPSIYLSTVGKKNT